MALISTIGHGVKPQSPERRELSSLDSRLLWQVCNVSWSDKPEDRWAMARVVTFLSRRSASESDVESLGTNMSSMDLHGHPSPYAARAKSSDHVSSSQPSLKRPEKASSRKEKTSSTIISSKFRKSFQKFRGNCPSGLLRAFKYDISRGDIRLNESLLEATYAHKWSTQLR